MAKKKPVSEETTTDKPSLKKRWQRIKPTRRNVDRGQKAMLRHLRKFLIQRWDNLRVARREVISWLLLMVVLVMIGCFQMVLYSRDQETVAPVDGGTYAEGIVDRVVTINPLFTVTNGERAASSLVYASLFSLDETGHLRPELATSYSVDADGKTYHVRLRDNVKWSDGEDFTADDVVLTVELMQNPSVESTHVNTWKNIAVEKISGSEVAFTLKGALASFPLTLDFGILPAHILKDVKPTDIEGSFSSLDAELVGTGAFTFRDEETLEDGQTLLRFSANNGYFRGAPRLKTLNIQTFASSEDLLYGLEQDEINAAAGLGLREASESLGLDEFNLVQTTQGDGVFALFNNSGEVTSDLAVRQALRLGVDRLAVRQAVTSGTQLEPMSDLETPITPGLIASVDKLKQPDYDAKAAADKLEAAGWKLDGSGKRVKDGKTLSLSIVTVEGADYEPAAKNLANQWSKLGIKVEIETADPSSVQQNYLIPRAYDVLVYQLHLGADPDIFAFWASSQATARGLNFANYRSPMADLILNNARTQTDKSKRSARYLDFVKQWLNDAPAIALYQPMYYYLTDSSVRGLDSAVLFDNASRFTNVREFTAKMGTVKVTP
jgi:peptide/nickel transport system substrate-binding protein